MAAVSDRGQRHHHNEDAVAVCSTGSDTAVLVVCDGVSSTPGSAEVSALAATIMAEALAEAVAPSDRDPEAPTDDASGSDGMALSDDALDAAVEAVQFDVGAASLGMDIDELNPPSTTLVAAVARTLESTVLISVVWLGDSRAYWIDGDDVRLLTVDHEVDGALTRWIGIDAAHHLPQNVHHEFPLTPDAQLIVCSDGMWRYFDPDLGEPADKLIRRLADQGLDGLDLVRALVDHANDCGGHDNISVARWSPGSAHRDGGTTVEAVAGGPPHSDPDDDPAKESRS